MGSQKQPKGIRPEGLSAYFVYIIEMVHRDDAWIKIGITKSLLARLAGLQTGSPLRLHKIRYAEVRSGPYAKNLEVLFHSMLGHRRVSGEWFTGAITEDLLAEFSSACAGYGTQLTWLEYAIPEYVARANTVGAQRMIKAAHRALKEQMEKDREHEELARLKIERDARMPRPIISYLGRTKKPALRGPK